MIFDGILNRAPASARTLNPGLPQELERIVGRCLEKDRERRYQHAAEIRADLQRLKRDRQSARPAWRNPTAARCSRGVAALAVAAPLSSWRPPSRVRSISAPPRR